MLFRSIEGELAQLPVENINDDNLVVHDELAERRARRRQVS
nr:hypothetical protein [uncultured Mobiluncus sp.]